VFVFAVVNFLHAFIDMDALFKSLVALAMPSTDLLAPLSNWIVSGIVLLIHLAVFATVWYLSSQWGKLPTLLPPEATLAKASNQPPPARRDLPPKKPTG